MSDIPLFSMLENKLRFVNQRERLLSENIANSDTPGYQPRDLKAFDAMVGPGAGAMTLTQTSGAHMAGHASRAPDPFRSEASPDSETRLDGNSVVLEEQMSKMTESRIDYETAIDFYQQSNSMLSLAARAPGKSS